MLTKHLSRPLKIKSVSESGEFEGYGSVFGNEDSWGDIVMPGAFEDTLDEHKSAGTLPAMLWQHKTDEPIGVYTAMAEDEMGLKVTGRLLVDADPLAKRAHAHMQAGSITGLSIGYSFYDSEDWEWDSAKGAFLLHRVKLWEVSPVTFPANEEARINDVKNMFQMGDIPSERTLERTLRDVGFSRTQSKAFIAGGYKNISARDAGDDSEMKELAEWLSNLAHN